MQELTATDRRALLAAAKSAETWNPKKHGRCGSYYYHLGYPNDLAHG